MKAKNHYIVRRSSYRQPRFRAKGLVVTGMLCLTAFCIMAYFYFAPGYAEDVAPPGNTPLPTATGRLAVTADCAVTDDSATQAGATACQEITELTDQGDTLFSLMNENIVDEQSARTVATRLASLVRSSLNRPFAADTPLKAGVRYSVTVDPNGAFLKGTVELEPAEVFHAALRDGTLHCWKEEVVVDFRVESVQFRMKGNLTDSVINAGEGTELASRLRSVFKWDIDFQSESVRGDTCKVLFERRYADDRPSGYGNVLCAVYEGKKIGGEGKKHGKKTAILFGGKYYDEKGQELKKDFLRSPLKVIRVTSHFGNRFHPVHRVWRKHNGVDYGAPEGTPVLSVANGVVTFAGWQNGYGNYVCIKHDNGYETRYGHLKRFFVKAGDRVKQHEKIALVGMTGVATGPHLDFQLLVNNRHENPLKRKMVMNIPTVPEALRLRFMTVVNQRLGSLGKLALIALSNQDLRSAQ